MSTNIENIRLSARIEELNTLSVMLSMAPSEINDDDLTNLWAALNTLKQRVQETGKRAVAKGNPAATILERWGDPPLRITLDDEMVQTQLQPDHIVGAKDQPPLTIHELIKSVKEKGEIIVDFCNGLQSCICGLAASNLEDWEVVQSTEYDPIEELCSEPVVTIKDWESYAIMEKVVRNIHKPQQIQVLAKEAVSRLLHIRLGLEWTRAYKHKGGLLLHERLSWRQWEWGGLTNQT
ncbi:hypothetical protein BS47DRAFT_1365986 [Hydnum rufescens UP504]|uniref:Uncharacterized protein n=1 Tax=Hydnum rufescens UP504 TaxID=1448309 RepID=A0A9P6AM59_9AGAM|nr:hypothetical protein BS47DRAFT_1365986 [Hydnum rufescens UP504]